MNRGTRIALVPTSVAALVVVACSGSSTGTSGGSGCPSDYSGSYSLSGSCNPKSCTFAQKGCSATASCNDGTRLSGSVSGTNASLSGVAADSSSVSCSVGFGANGSVTLTCSGSSVCQGTGTCKSGSCGAPVGGSSGTGTTSGTTSGSGGSSSGTTSGSSGTSGQ